MALATACSSESPSDAASSQTGVELTTAGSDDSSDGGNDAGGSSAMPDLGGADDGFGEPAACDVEPPAPVMVPVDLGCVTEPEVGTFTPVVEWTKHTWSTVPSSRGSVTTPLVVQLSDDDLDGEITEADMPDIVFHTSSGGGVLRAVSGDGTEEILSAPTNGFSRDSTFAAADIDDDGVVEILGIDGSQRVVAFEHDGTEKWISPSLANHLGLYDNGVAISDMDGDGVPEIIAGRAILDADGDLIAAGTHGRGTSSGIGSAALSFAVDVDDDGQQEVVVGNALYRRDGSSIWFNGEPDGYPAVADFDADGRPEIVVVWLGHVRLQSSVDGSVLWSTDVPGGNGGPPTIADYDGDGAPEIGIAGTSTYTVFEGDGTVRWSRPTQDGSSGVTGSAVFDFEGDGVAEVVYADETRLWIFAGPDGSIRLEFADHSSGTRVEYPIIADVDGDGEVEIAFVNELYGGAEAAIEGLTVIGDANHSWQPGRKIWNQHAYHLTNIDDDGSVPAAAAANWKSFNSFRSGHTGPNDGLAVPAVQVIATGPCEGGCTDGLRRAFVQVANPGGGETSSTITLEVFGVTESDEEELVGSFLIEPPLAAGASTAGFEIEVDPAEYRMLRARADSEELLCSAAVVQIEVVIPSCATPAG